MRYKAIMLDVDGTIIPYQFDALPSLRVKKAIQLAREQVHVCLVTGRSYQSTKHILTTLGMTEGYAVVDAGALVFDIATDKVIFKQPIDDADVKHVIRVFEQEQVTFYIKNEENPHRQKKDFYPPYEKGQDVTDTTMFFTDEEFSLETTHRLLKLLARPHLTITRSLHKDPSKYSFNITHVNATKLHGIQFLSEKLGLKTHEIIGVGDGYNDFPLLMASGLKVAMGNAVEDLKEIADYIAPSVDDDGVADVIERYIIKTGNLS